MVMLVSEEQLQNVPHPIEGTPFGKIMSVSEEQLVNDSSLIKITLLGMIMLVSEVQSVNALTMPFVSLRKVTWVAFLSQPIAHLPKYCTLFSVCVFSEVQPENAYPLIEITLSGISIFVSEEQFSNAPLPIEVTLFGIVMLVSLPQPLNAAPRLK